jgi:superoxide dismutase
MLRLLVRPSSFALPARSLHTLPPLDFDIAKGLAPVITPAALDLHYNKHHAAYVANTNRLVEGWTRRNSCGIERSPILFFMM